MTKSMPNRKPLPENNTRNDLLDAINELGHKIPEGYADSTKFDVLHEGKRYPPKPIVGLAATKVSRDEFLGKHFSGEIGSKCFQILERHDFEIVTKANSYACPDDIVDDKHNEGAGQQVLVNRYERDATARIRCIKHYGTKCTICNFDFASAYGAIGEGFIHVHHLTPISEIGEEHELHPISDLRPVCPNCHAMLHKRRPPFTIKELKWMMA